MVALPNFVSLCALYVQHHVLQPSFAVIREKYNAKPFDDVKRAERASIVKSNTKMLAIFLATRKCVFDVQ